MKKTLQFLGQVGFLFEVGSRYILIDPYLSNSVGDQFGESLNRLVELSFTPEMVPACDVLLLTHAHLDHTDPASLDPLFKQQPEIRIFAPSESRKILLKMRMHSSPPPTEWIDLGSGIGIRAVPAAHTALERDNEGEWACVGYLLRLGNTSIYHAGDTIPHPDIFESLRGETIDYALLPVNERNFYRDAQGIIGNMTLREAFQMAADLGVKTFIPTHWDMFAPNSVFPEEIELLHKLLAPPFQLKILHAGQALSL